MVKGDVGVQQAIDVGDPGGKLVIPHGTLKGHSEQQGDEGVVHGRGKGKDERRAGCLAGDTDTGIHKGVGSTRHDTQKERNENKELTPSQKDVHLAEGAAERNASLQGIGHLPTETKEFLDRLEEQRKAS